ncbi:hypothetical protein S7335_4464 [Synechococcus sp. PCC 7335]|nr:hypothetical protein S7335_4464 [Synechococcus sp. PCC 7335]
MLLVPTVWSAGMSVQIEAASAQTLERELSARDFSFRQLFKRIFRDDEWQDPPTISRGELCLLAPAWAGQEMLVWHEGPVFVWRGAIAKMAVVDSVNNAVMWEYEPQLQQRFVQYEGEPLQSGRLYRWQVYDDGESTAPIASASFEVMSRAQQQLVANGLAIAESKVAGIAASKLTRVEYFAARGLPTDALQSLFLINSTDVDLVEARQETVDRLCE